MKQAILNWIKSNKPDNFKANKIIELFEDQNKELIEENKGLKIQARAFQDAINELLNK